MKTTVKNIGKLLAVILFIVFGMTAKAQSHIRSASNCILYDAYLKETSKTKNAVSCVDCYCKVCGDKKKKEKEAKRKAEELANEKKTSTSQKNTTQKTTSKTKNNEAILVAPKQNTGKSKVVILSADDQEIVDAAKKLNNVGDNLSFRSVGPGIIKKDYDNTIELNILSPEYIQTILRKNFIIKSSLEYNEVFGMVTFRDKEDFLNTGLYVVKITGKDYSRWYDLADIQGNCILNDKEVSEITYNKANKTFSIMKRGQNQPTSEYNPVTKKITPIK